jgi:hypothetical protein
MVDWKMKQNTLARTLCEKRNVKGSCCKAKCQLKKRLADLDRAEDSNESSSKSQKMKAFMVDDFVEPAFIEISILLKTKPNETYSMYSETYHYLFDKSHNKPPVLG